MTRSHDLLSEYPSLEVIRDNPSEWCRRILGFHPTGYQAPILDTPLHLLTAAILRAGRRSGKTEVLAASVVYWATRLAMTIYIVSPALRQSDWAKKKIRRFIYQSHYLPFLQALGLPDFVVKDNEDELVFRNGSSIACLPAPPQGKTIRGMSYDLPEQNGLCIFDEAAYIPPEIIQNVEASTVSGNVGIVYASTPCGKQGLFYETARYIDERIQQGDSAFRHWHFTAYDAIKAGIARADKVALAKARLSGDAFLSEYLAEFVSGQGRVFDFEAIDECSDAKREGPQSQYYYLLTADLGWENDACQIYVWRIARDFQSLWLVDSAAFINKKLQQDNPRYANYIPVRSYSAIRDYIVQQAQRYRLISLEMDCSNQSALADMLKADNKLATHKCKFSRVSKPIAIEDLATAVRGNAVHFWKDSELSQQLQTYSFEWLNGKKVYSDGNDDCVMSASLAAAWLFNHGASIRPATYLTAGRRDSVWA